MCEAQYYIAQNTSYKSIVRGLVRLRACSNNGLINSNFAPLVSPRHANRLILNLYLSLDKSELGAKGLSDNLRMFRARSLCGFRSFWAAL